MAQIDNSKKCKNPDCENTFFQYKTTDKYCSLGCHRQMEAEKIKKPRKRIPAKSEKMKILDKKYAVLRKDFLLNAHPYCPIYPQYKVTEVHHKKGRIGYADQYARDRNMSLMVDRRFFLAVSRQGHKFIEENPEWSIEHGFSLLRNEEK